MNYDALLGHIATLHALTTGRAAAAVNQALLVRNSLSLPGLRVDAMAPTISATVSRKLSGQELPPLPAEAVFRLSWSHLVELLRIDAPWKRAFYEKEWQ
jgi:hypothetical protein